MRIEDEKTDNPHRPNRPERIKKKPEYLEDYMCNSTKSTHWCNSIQFHALSSAHKQIAQSHYKYIEPNL